MRFGPIMTTGRCGLAAVRSPVIMRDANITEFIMNGELVLVELPYRDFFARSLNSDNKVAFLMEGLLWRTTKGTFLQPSP